MSRKTARLTLDNLAEIPAPCSSCLFWELDPVRRARVSEAAAPAEKEAWLTEVLREWGSCGQVVLVDDHVAGYVVYAPAALVPGAAGFPTAPVSEDALLLTALRVEQAYAGAGLGRVLVQAMARDLVRRGDIRAVEAFGEQRVLERRPPKPPARDHAGCVVPAGFLSRVGFKTQRAHPTHPRMRMDLRSALTWKDEVEQALERLLGAVRPARPAPKPAQPPARSS